MLVTSATKKQKNDSLRQVCLFTLICASLGLLNLVQILFAFRNLSRLEDMITLIYKYVVSIITKLCIHFLVICVP